MVLAKLQARNHPRTGARINSLQPHVNLSSYKVGDPAPFHHRTNLPSYKIGDPAPRHPCLNLPSCKSKVVIHLF